ncbi:hypothetical protein TNCV_4270621 [Trichonephila clavipes]|nr:hypothetical protein TNCV_4270621 [Trichonephila clavipes]
MWNVTDWQKVVFSDESRFVLGTYDYRVRVWRCPGERYYSSHTVLRHTANTAGVMVWGAIAYDIRSTLIVMRGTLMGQRTATAGSDVVQSGRPIFDDFFQHLWPYICNNTANVVFQMVKRLWLIRIDQ